MNNTSGVMFAIYICTKFNVPSSVVHFHILQDTSVTKCACKSYHAVHCSASVVTASSVPASTILLLLNVGN